MTRRRRGGPLEVLADPLAARLEAVALLGRLPLGMVPLGIVLLLRAHGHSYAVAGAAVAAYSVGISVANPMWGRAVDRRGAPRVLARLAVTFPTLIVALSLSPDVGGGAPTVVLGGLCGASLPPLGACMRAAWPLLVAEERLRGAAYAVEAVVQEIAFVVGPLLVAAIATALSTAAGLWACAASAAVGAGAFAALYAKRLVARLPRASGTGERRRIRGALRSAGVQTVLMAHVAMGVGFGAFEVAMPAFAEHRGHRSSAGLMIGMLALGSLLGGLLAARWPARRGQQRRFAVALAALALAFVPLLVAQSIPVMTVLALVAGLPIAPGFAAAYSMLDALAVPGAATETFAWVGTAITAGAAAGTGLGGVLIKAGGYRAALALGLAGAVLALVLVSVRRSTMHAPPPSDAGVGARPTAERVGL